MREEPARSILRSGLENLIGEKDHRHFDDRKQQGEEQRRNQRKFNRCAASPVRAKAAKNIPQAQRARR
jgi:hypothetical protein